MKQLTIAYLALGIFAGGLSLAATSPATAADDPVNVIKFRQLLMKSIGAHMGSIAMVAKREVGYGPEQIEDHAASIALVANLISTAFKENAGQAAETTAKDNIWTDWAGFEAKAEDLRTAAIALTEAAATGDAGTTGAAVGKLGGACGACHEVYRVKKD